MAVIPNESARMKRLRLCERELARKKALDDQLGKSRRRRPRNNDQSHVVNISDQEQRV